MKRELLLWALLFTWEAAWTARAAEEVKVFEVPEGATLDVSSGRKPIDSVGALKTGGVLQNNMVELAVLVGSAGPVLRSVRADAPATAMLSLLLKGAAGKVEKVELLKKERTEAVLRLTQGSSQADLKLRPNQPFVEIISVKEFDAVEVQSNTVYTVLPDFFGHDVVFDPKRLKSDTVTPSAENFLLNMQAGGDAIVMCVWQGVLSLGKQAKGDEKEPRVDLILAGKGKDRMVEKTRLEFCGRPLYVALLAKKGLWFQKDISADPANKPMALDWAPVSMISGDWLKENVPMALDWTRPYEAKWRAIFVGKPGHVCDDFMVKDVTWDITYDSDWPASQRDKAGNPVMSWQGEWKNFTLPAWIQDKGSGKTFISIYASREEKMNWQNKARLAQAKKDNTPCVPQYPKSSFDTLIVYAIDRRKDTPILELTPTDVMRESLGIGPCEYVLDLEGLKNNTTRNGHYVHPTCHTYEAYVAKFAEAAAGKNTTIPKKNEMVPLAGLKAGEKFQPEEEAILIDRLEDLAWFGDTLNKRLHQYNTFAQNMVALCNAEVGMNPALKPIAGVALNEANRLLQQCSKDKLDGLTKKRDAWVDKLNAVIAEVKSGVYRNVGSTGAIRDDFAVHQDILVGVCHRSVKGLRQKASVVDASNSEVTAFANKVRSMCHDMLRNKGHFE